MFRRLFVLFALSLLVGGLVFWSDIGLLLFGRCDAKAWAASHAQPAPPPAALGRHVARVLETRRIVPRDGLPPSVDLKRSNNNLDVTRFGGRTYLAYITQAKRCSLWRHDRETGKVGFVLDLPSRGDTCFASVLPGDAPDRLVVYDYSSDITGPELPWTAGQRRPTYIYRHVLELAPR
jgi:hypothetical protein